MFPRFEHVMLQDKNAMAEENRYPHDIHPIDHQMHYLACPVGVSHGPQEFQSSEIQMDMQIPSS